MKNIKERLIERLTNNYWKIFHIDEVKDLGTLHYLMTNIYELKKEGYLIRLTYSGWYEFRGINYYDGLICPATAQDVALLLQRKFNWNLIPSRDFAMSMFGVGKECEEYCYISDRKDLRIEFNETLLIVEHVDRSLFKTYSYNTLLVLEVLKAIGIKDLTENHLKAISKRLWRREKEIIYQEIKDKQFKFKDQLLYICRY